MPKRLGPNDPRRLKLRVLLLKEGISSPEEAVTDETKDRRKFKWYELKPNLDFKGKFLLRKNPGKPSWLPFINQGLAKPIDVETKSAAAILFVEVTFKNQRRILTYAFGYSKGYLRPDVFEFDFGIDTVLSAVDPEHIQGLESKELGEVVKITSQQTSRQAAMSTFDFDFRREILRLVSGKPTDSKLGKSAAGSDSYAFDDRLTFSELGKKSLEILKVYDSELYKMKFPRYGSFGSVKKRKLKSDLDEILDERIKGGRFAKIDIAPPQNVDLESLQGYRYYPFEGEEKDPHPSLDKDDFVNLLDLSKITLDDLKNNIRIRGIGAGSERTYSWSAYRCLVFETQYDGRTYVLSDGKWYGINQDIVDAIDDYIRDSPAPEVRLPDAKPGETEDEYNDRVPNEVEGVVKLHRVGNIKTPAMNSSIEPCDLFSLKGEFVHIKRLKNSNISRELSHLFAQGSGSADCFLNDFEFRKKLRERIPENNPEHARLISNKRPKTSKYSVVYGVMTTPRDIEKEDLPFLSRLNFMHHARIIGVLGYKRVSLVLV